MQLLELELLNGTVVVVVVDIFLSIALTYRD